MPETDLITGSPFKVHFFSIYFLEEKDQHLKICSQFPSMTTVCCRGTSIKAYFDQFLRCQWGFSILGGKVERAWWKGLMREEGATWPQVLTAKLKGLTGRPVWAATVTGKECQVSGCSQLQKSTWSEEDEGVSVYIRERGGWVFGSVRLCACSGLLTSLSDLEKGAGSPLQQNPTGGL